MNEAKEDEEKTNFKRETSNKIAPPPPTTTTTTTAATAQIYENPAHGMMRKWAVLL